MFDDPQNNQGGAGMPGGDNQTPVGGDQGGSQGQNPSVPGEEAPVVPETPATGETPAPVPGEAPATGDDQHQG